jgi:hypothetical protein
VDLPGELENDVRHTLELREFWQRFAPDAIADARTTIVQAINDRYSQAVPAVAGVHIRFEGTIGAG